MAYREMFFVQLFGYTHKDELIPGAIYPADDSEQAVLRAKACADRGAPGAIAFSQLVDDRAEHAEEPKLLAGYGHVPREARAAA